MFPDTTRRLRRAAVAVNPTKLDDVHAVREEVTSGMREGDPIRATARTVVVANVTTLPGGVAQLPDARPDDTLDDVAIVEGDNLADWLRVTGRVMTRRTRVDDRYTTPHAQHIQISMRSEDPRQADGDLTGDSTGMGVQIEAGAPAPGPGRVPLTEHGQQRHRPGVRQAATSTTTEVKAG